MNKLRFFSAAAMLTALCACSGNSDDPNPSDDKKLECGEEKVTFLVMRDANDYQKYSAVVNGSFAEYSAFYSVRNNKAEYSLSTTTPAMCPKESPLISADLETVFYDSEVAMRFGAWETADHTVEMPVKKIGNTVYSGDDYYLFTNTDAGYAYLYGHCLFPDQREPAG